jgi:4-hydroxybutyrate CoA-transferase
MNGWVEYYRARITTAPEAVRVITSGQRIVISHACGEPRTLVGELVKRSAELRDVEIVHMVPMGETAYCRPEYAASFRHVALFSGGPTREAIWDNRAD